MRLTQKDGGPGQQNPNCERQKQGCQPGSGSGPLPAGQIVLLISQDDSKRKRRLGEAKSFVHGPELLIG